MSFIRSHCATLIKYDRSDWFNRSWSNNCRVGKINERRLSTARSHCDFTSFVVSMPDERQKSRSIHFLRSQNLSQTKNNLRSINFPRSIKFWRSKFFWRLRNFEMEKFFEIKKLVEINKFLEIGKFSPRSLNFWR